MLKSQSLEGFWIEPQGCSIKTDTVINFQGSIIYYLMHVAKEHHFYFVK